MNLDLLAITSYTNKAVLLFKHLQFGTKRQLAFLEDLYLLINDGIPANRAIDMMSQVSTGVNRDVALSLSEKIGQGQPLAEGMREWFSMNVVEIIRVGETGGALAQTIKSAINMLSQQGVAIGAFIGAIVYPLTVIITACFLILYLNSSGSVLAQFKQMKPVDQWPDAGQRLIWMSDIIKFYWWIFVAILIAIVVILRQIMQRYTGPFRATLDRFPPFSFYRRLTAARVLETLGLLVANGVVFRSAISVMQTQANPYLMYHLTGMEHLLSMGKTNIADVLDTGLIDEADLTRLRVMAEVKGFEHGLIRMGLRGAEQVTATLKFISRIIGGVLLIVGGILIILIIQGVYSTGMSMSST